MKSFNIEKAIKDLLLEGVYCQHKIFNILYPTYTGHYYTLRTKIAKVKNEGI